MSKFAIAVLCVLFTLTCIVIFIYKRSANNLNTAHTSTNTQAPKAPAVSKFSPIQPAAWKTYTTSKYTIQYPANWFVHEYKDENNCIDLSDIVNPQDVPASINPDNHQIIGVCVYSGTMPTTFPYDNGSSKNTTVKPFNINGYIGIRGNDVSTIGIADDVYLANPKGGYIYFGKEIGDTGIFNQVLSTFRFID